MHCLPLGPSSHPDLMDIILNANKERQQKQQSTIDINAISKSSCLSPYQYSILYGHMECLQRLAQEEGLDFTALVWDQKHTVFGLCALHG